MHRIKTIGNFITPQEASIIIEYIDKNKHTFSSDNGGLWFKKFFGIDDIYKHGKGYPVIDGLGDIKELSIEIVEKVKRTMVSEFDDNNIFLNSLWYTKHMPGDTVVGHVDTEEGYNQQFVYSAILYLNKVDEGGELDFPLLDLSFKPQAYDLIIFPSDGEEMFHEVKAIGQDRYTLPMWFTKDETLELKFK
jgi:hypothetical protein